MESRPLANLPEGAESPRAFDSIAPELILTRSRDSRKRRWRARGFDPTIQEEQTQLYFGRTNSDWPSCALKLQALRTRDSPWKATPEAI